MSIIKIFKLNNLAYLDYDRSYDRNMVTVLATDFSRRHYQFRYSCFSRLTGSTFFFQDNCLYDILSTCYNRPHALRYKLG